ncbi:MULTISPECIES: hypothetical protein [Pseudoalteromonas]|uniref:hypothetical protein n=1 Tax=Pseudoalteromonas TaxID=53246 RepID=UPI0015816F6D|nr:MULTISPECIES: hypothetical protein [Pseudoalteromonas]MDI4652604.1 hypothetical protein [Pseudoalteromonas shioyasakiensis]NUJ38687.1 hypothetical protein [Pseudoalteromonas sp. 0303]
MNKTLLNTIVLSTLGLSLAGCIAIKPDEKFDKEMQEQQAQIQKIKQTKNYAVLNTPKVSYEAFIGSPANKDVFDTTHINMGGMKNGATLRAVIQMFQKKGLNVIAQNGVNLDQSVLNYSIKNASARRALDMVTYDLGIGYHMVDDGKGRPYAVLTGLPSFEYRLNIPNEVKTLSQFVVNKTKETEANLGGAGGNSSGGSSGSSGGSSANGSGNSDVNTLSSLAEIKTAFWDDTESFLNALVKELVLPSGNRSEPRADNFQLVDGPNGQMYQPRVTSNATAHNQTSAVERKVGVVSINRSTGHIYVSAPKHTLDRVQKYLKEIDLLMNSKIVIKGRIIAQTETERQQKGLDVAALAPYCTHSYRCIVSNDIYNNVSITEPGVNTWFSAGVDNMIGSSMLGIQSLDQTWQVFNAYTEDNANIRTIGNFEGEAFHGEDITLSDVQNRINQQLSTNDSVTSDGVTTGGGTSSDLIPYKIGSVITVLPMLDMVSGTVKTKVDVKLSVLGENKEITNVIGDDVQKGYYQNVDTMEFKVSPKLKPGELVIAAGRTQTRLSNSIGGTSGLKDSYLGALFGNSERLKEKVTYYILLQAKVVPASV